MLLLPLTMPIASFTRTFSADSVPYQYTFPENSSYTGQEFVDLQGRVVIGANNPCGKPAHCDLDIKIIQAFRSKFILYLVTQRKGIIKIQIILTPIS